MNTILIKDKIGLGKVTNEIEVSFKSERVTVREIIEARVLQEVEMYNNKLPDYFTGLIQPIHAEETLNGYKMKERKKIDAEKQVYIALDAFNKNAYFLLVNNKQAETLEQEVILSPATTLSFMKLVPLVGG